MELRAQRDEESQTIQEKTWKIIYLQNFIHREIVTTRIAIGSQAIGIMTYSKNARTGP